MLLLAVNLSAIHLSAMNLSDVVGRPAAWAANDIAEIHGTEMYGTEIHGQQQHAPAQGTATVAIPSTTAARGVSMPTFGTRSADATTLAAGAVLGAAGAVAAGALLRGMRSLRGLTKR